METPEINYFKNYDEALDTFKEMAEKINTQYEKELKKHLKTRNKNTIKKVI